MNDCRLEEELYEEALEREYKLKVENKELKGILKEFLVVREHMKAVNVKSYDKYKTLLDEKMVMAEQALKESEVKK